MMSFAGIEKTQYSLPAVVILGFLLNLFCWYNLMTSEFQVWVTLGVLGLTADSIFIANIIQQYRPEANDDIIR